LSSFVKSRLIDKPPLLLKTAIMLARVFSCAVIGLVISKEGYRC